MSVRRLWVLGLLAVCLAVAYFEPMAARWPSPNRGALLQPSLDPAPIDDRNSISNNSSSGSSREPSAAVTSGRSGSPPVAVTTYARILPREGRPDALEGASVRLFCPSFTTDARMRFRFVPRKEPRVASVLVLPTTAVPECPAPIELLRIPRFNRPRNPRANKQLRPPRNGRAFHCDDLRIWDTIDIPSSLLWPPGSHAPRPRSGDTIASAYDQGVYCVRRCLASPCCVGVQLDNAPPARRRCYLLACRNGAIDFVDASPKKEVALFAYRREVRPSLLTDAPRLVLAAGFPGRGVILIDPLTGALPSPLVVHAYGAFGWRLFLPLTGPVHCALRAEPVDGRGGFAAEASAWMVDGRVNVSTHGFGVGHALAQLEGRVANLACRFAGNATPALAVVAPTPPLPLLVLQRATGFKLRFADNGTTDRGSETCAPLLRQGECCLRGLRVVHVGPAPRSTTNASLEGIEGLMVKIGAVGPPASQRPPCAVIIDGSVAVFDEAGVAEWTHLVVRAAEGCGESEGDDLELESANYFVGSVFTQIAMRSFTSRVRVPRRALVGCNPRAGTAAAAAAAAVSATPGAASSAFVDDSENDDGPPVLLSVRVHGRVDLIEDLLRNLRAFVWPSIVVIHISPVWKPLPSEAERLAKLNETAHPRTYISPYQLRLGFTFSTHMHALNIQYIARDLRLNFSHVLAVASNELFVRRGLVRYVRRFDMANPTSPTTGRAGFLVKHVDEFTGARPRFDTLDLQQRAGHSLWPWVPPEGLASEFHMAAAIRRRHEQQPPLQRQQQQQPPLLPTAPMFEEGAFLSRDLALELVRSLAEDFPDTSLCLETSWMPTAEVFLQLHHHDRCVGDRPSPSPSPATANGSRPLLRCGERVSTLLMNSPIGLWFARDDDVREVRCSPFDVPFGFKRVNRAFNDSVRLAVRAVMSDPQRLRLVRENC